MKIFRIERKRYWNRKSGFLKEILFFYFFLLLLLCKTEWIHIRNESNGKQSRYDFFFISSFIFLSFFPSLAKFNYASKHQKKKTINFFLYQFKTKMFPNLKKNCVQTKITNNSIFFYSLHKIFRLVFFSNFSFHLIDWLSLF